MKLSKDIIIYIILPMRRSLMYYDKKEELDKKIINMDILKYFYLLTYPYIEEYKLDYYEYFNGEGRDEFQFGRLYIFARLLKEYIIFIEIFNEFKYNLHKYKEIRIYITVNHNKIEKRERDKKNMIERNKRLEEYNMERNIRRQEEFDKFRPINFTGFFR